MAEWVTRWEDRTGDALSDCGLPPMPRGPEAVRQVYSSGRAHLFAAMLNQWGDPPEGFSFPLSLEPLLGPLPSLDLTGIGWVIVGGESGPGARPMHPDWARDIRDRCVEQGVPFFFKQWGRWGPAAPAYPDSDDEVEFDAWDRLGDWESLAAVEPSGAIPQTINPDWCDHQPRPGSWWMAPVGKREAGRVLDGRTWDQMPHDRPNQGDRP